VDAPLQPHDALIRPWRTATIAASLVAAVELVLLLGAAFLLLAKPLSHAMQRHAAATAFAPVARPDKPVVPKQAPIGLPKLLRSETKVFVLNGNGRNGAASAAASRLSDRGYRIPGTGNAKRQDYATTVVMYKRGFHAEGVRLAHDMHFKVVGPLDGIAPATMSGAQLAIILGAR